MQQLKRLALVFSSLVQEFLSCSLLNYLSTE